MEKYDIALTDGMLNYAKSVEQQIKVNRTIASPKDTIVGSIGELAFAQWFLGDYKNHDLTATKGKIDFFNSIEVKTSAFPYSEKLNLLVRNDYAKKRIPSVYVQIIIDINPKKIKELNLYSGLICKLCGWASHNEVIKAPLKDFGNKWGGKGGYKCHFIPISKLNSMETFPVKK